MPSIARRAPSSWVAAISLAAALLVSAAPSPALAQDKWLELSIPDGLSDQSGGGLAFFGEGAISTRELLEMIDRAKDDKQVKAIILKAPGGGLGFAKTQELRDALAKFRASGKKIYVYLEAADNGIYYLASAANEIVVNPVGMVFLNGLSSETMFLRGVFDKLGIVPNYEQCYEYKSAADMYVRKDMSEAHKEVTNSILDDIYGQWTEAIASSRKLPVEKVKAIVDACDPLPESAKRDGLVDQLLYADEFEAYLEKENGGKKLEKVKTKDYRTKKGGLFNLSFDFGDKPKIAIVYGQGAITSGKSANDFLSGQSMGSDTIAAAIKEAREDKSVKAIVFRVDSPGGSALASDVIWRETVLAKKEKPFIVSMSNVAGSGGYYIAMAADKIVAEPGTITGSIGVLGGKLNLKGLYQWAGLNKVVTSRGKNAAIFSDWSDWSDSERGLFKGFIEHTYKTFVGKVAQGRKRTPEEIHKIAKGRIWTGRQGKEIGLVDELGGLDKAIALAKEAAGIPEKTEPALVEFPKQKDLFEMIEEMIEAKAFSQAFSAEGLLTGEAREVLGTLRLMEKLSDEKVLCLMPELIEIK